MNYIKRLESENDNKKTCILEADQLIEHWKLELIGNKFTGTDLDGSRKDWQSTMDITIRLEQIRNALFQAL